MRRVVPTPRSPFRFRRGSAPPTLLTLAVLLAVGSGCASKSPPTSPPTTGPSTEEAESVTGTQLTGDQLVRVTGTVQETDAPGCLLLDTGTTHYLLIGGDTEIIEPDAKITVTGNANPQTPTSCAGGTPLTVSEVVPAE